MTPSSQFLALIMGWLLPVLVVSYRTIPTRHAVSIENESGRQLVVDWYNPSTGTNMEFHRMQPHEKIAVNSFANHTFVLHFDNATCTDQVCRSAVVTVTDNDDQVILVKDGPTVEYSDSSMEASVTAEDIVQSCHAVAKDQLEAGIESGMVLKEMYDCVREGTADVIEKLHEAQMFESTLRQSVSDKVENYTCADEMIETTKAKEIRQWEHKNVTRNVHMLHERKASKIHMIENFISPEECAAISEAARPKLHHGTVADGKGGHRLSEHRKAMQAGVAVPWDQEEQGDPIARVVRRLYDYTNHATGFGLEVEGQEDLMSIQYFGRGKEDKAPDRYMPHCDGDCNGLPHKKGGRVATMVMYCDTEGLVGGGTNFGHAGVFVRPKVGAAAFFSYLDPETHIHETGFTTHSGCPVVEGVKRIAVHWMRIGVNNDTPWDSFNTLNILKEECEDD